MAEQILVGSQLAHILLVIMLFVVMGRRKFAAVAAGQVNRQKAALDKSQWPEDVQKATNCIANQFEAPVLFHVLALIAQAQQLVSPFMAGLAIVFIVTRYAHAWVHTTSNYVPHRFRLFAVGLLCVLLMCVTLAWMWGHRLMLAAA